MNRSVGVVRDKEIKLESWGEDLTHTRWNGGMGDLRRGKWIHQIEETCPLRISEFDFDRRLFLSFCTSTVTWKYKTNFVSTDQETKVLVRSLGWLEDTGVDCQGDGSYTLSVFCRDHGDVTHGGPGIVLWRVRITSHNTEWLIDSPLEQVFCLLWFSFIIPDKERV